MKRSTFSLLILLMPILLTGQLKHDYVWLNGTAGIVDDPSDPYYDDFGINTLNFNHGELNITRDYRDSDFYQTCASISNTEGELLFYTNGCKVFRANGEVMENGGGLNPGTAYDTGQCPDNGNSVANGALILPLPGSDSTFYIFHKAKAWGDLITLGTYDAIVYTTVVDMALHGGQGAVLEKNDTVIIDTLFNDLHAVRHANGGDWWVVTSDGNSDLYHRILLTAGGVAGVSGQRIGPASDLHINGMSCFSPDGALFGRYDHTAQVLLYDFDRGTGELGNLRRLTADTAHDSRLGYSIAFSPSSRFLYVGSLHRLYQFDLEAADIQGSRVLLGEYDGHEHLGAFPSNFGFMRLAPDCRIYMSTRSSTPMYHVINNPDRKGLACDFVQRGLVMPAFNISAIPNFPNYRLGTGHPVCDSTIQLVVGSVPVRPPGGAVRVYPNPAGGQVTVELPVPLPGGSEWVLYNGVGQRVRAKVVAKGTVRASVGIGGLPNGLYHWEVRSQEGRLDRGKLIVSK